MLLRMVDEEFVRSRTTEVSLPDGGLVRLRPIVPEDKSVLVEGFQRLSPESRYRRFMAPIAELTEEQLAELTEVDYLDRFAWMAFSLDEPGTPGMGVSRYVRDSVDPEVAEAAVTVIDDYHGRGLGRLLLEFLGAVALENGVKRFRGYLLEENRPMRELLVRLGAKTEHDSPGVLRMELDLPARAEELRGSPMYEVLRAVARGDPPVFIRPAESGEPAERRS
ncbi:MAG: GNAT family N-acetyltransferase [Actinomycetota bacterium]